VINIKAFTFNPFEENTYVLYDETGECVIIDPGCYTAEEKKELEDFISEKKLKPVKLLLTHAHIDHILGNNFVTGKYKVKIEMNEHDVHLLKAAPVYGEMWGIQCEPSPEPHVLLKEGDKITFGNSVLEIFFTPGHSEGSISFYSCDHRFIIGGDVLFSGSIGRTDLPGGNFETLIRSIKEKVFSLEDDYKVYSGHGPHTTIGHERKSNPFL
jgi:glyoxylase-like metal-dependent hydrolase (beta-lactamase superfamily II)